MPITFTIDKENHIIRFLLAGTLTTKEMLTAVDDAVKAAPERLYNVLSDHRSLETPATTDQIQSLVNHLLRYRSYFAGARWGVVVKTAASRGMMNILSVFAEKIPIEVQVFDKLREAEDWIGVEGHREGSA